MTRDEINALCASLPGAENSDPWGGGHDAWKVGGKMFACIGAVTEGVSVKTESIEMAQMLIDGGRRGEGSLFPPLLAAAAARNRRRRDRASHPHFL